MSNVFRFPGLLETMVRFSPTTVPAVPDRPAVRAPAPSRTVDVRPGVAGWGHHAAPLGRAAAPPAGARCE